MDRAGGPQAEGTQANPGPSPRRGGSSGARVGWWRCRRWQHRRCGCALCVGSRRVRLQLKAGRALQGRLRAPDEGAEVAPWPSPPRKASTCGGVRSRALPRLLATRTAHRHWWAGARAPRWTSDPRLRNSANWPRNFGRRGASVASAGLPARAGRFSERLGPVGGHLQSRREEAAASRLKRLFTKNTGLCHGASRRIGADACPVPEC